MRLSLCLLTTCGVLLASPASGERIFPYKAFISADDVYVRSGPGQSYYPTDKLKAGHKVEVYRHDPGGWYAIKPPKDSFAWVSGRYLTGGADNLAVVHTEHVAARVGSRFSDIREVIQVRLHKGEVVEVLDAKKTGSGARRKTWYKIAPPSGEFRWVFGKYVDPDYPADGVRQTHAAENHNTENRTAEAERAPAAANGDFPVDQHQAEPAAFVRQSADLRETPDPVEEPAAAVASDDEPFGPRALSPEQYQAELEEIDLELSTMVVEEPTVWSFDELRRRARSLQAIAETAVERGRARLLVGKITRFTDIKRRHDAVVAVRSETERSNRRLASLKRRADRPAGGESETEDDRYDAMGQLSRVVSPKLGAPRYALLDEQGDVRCYVSPAPGVKLRHHLGRHVGVTGTRGYMPEQRAHHVMVWHVSLLEGRTLR